MDGIITPEAVVLEVETAGVAARVMSGLIDLMVQLGVLFVVSFALVALGAAGGSSSATVNAIFFAVVVMGYPVVLETLWRGRTVGKKAMGLRAVTLEGSPIRLRHALLRMMGGLVDKFFPPVGVTGTLMVLGTRRHQRVGDLMAGTIVIRDPERTALPQALWFPVPPGYEAYAASIDPTAMTDEQYTVLRAFLVRNREFSPAARYALAAELAQRAAATLHHSWTPAVHPEAYLLCVVARYQRRMFPAYHPAAWSAPQRSA